MGMRDGPRNLRRRLLRISRARANEFPSSGREKSTWPTFQLQKSSQSCHDPVKGHGNSGKNKRREVFRMTQTDTANDQSLRTLIDADLQDTLDEELELELDDTRLEKLRGTVHQGR